MTDDEIKQMQKEIEQERKAGLGIPTEVTNTVAQQQMVGDIQNDQQLDMMKRQMTLQAKMMPQDPAQQSSPQSNPKKDKPKSSSKGSSKDELPSKINYPDVQLEDEGTFNKIKKLL